MNYIENRRKTTKRMIRVLNKCFLSNEKFDSTKVPFFRRDNDFDNFMIDSKKIENIPENLNRNISLLYHIIGNPKKELYIGEWTLFSLEYALEIYNEYKKNGQSNVFDIGYKYLGMGHIELISCDMKSHLLFYHRGGGSSGWDREENFKEIVNNGPDNYQKYYFSDWFYTIELDESK